MKKATQNIDDQVARYLNYWDSSDVEGILSMYASDMTYHDMPSGEVIERKNLRQYLEDTFKLQKDTRIKLNESSIIEGTTAFIYWTQTYVSSDTGRHVKVNGVELIVFRDGLIQRIHEFYEFQATSSVKMPSPGTDSYFERLTKLGLTKEMTDRMAEELEEYLKNDQPFLEPDLALATVADHLGYTRNQISFVINHLLDKTFYDLINGCRIDHAIANMSRSENTLSILELGFDAGFNSVSGFYSAFKKHTGKAPAQYLRELKRTG